MKEKTWRNKKTAGLSKPHSLTCWRRKAKGVGGEVRRRGEIIPGDLPSSAVDWDGQEEGHRSQDFDIKFLGSVAEKPPH
jgi:hypothetical protein